MVKEKYLQFYAQTFCFFWTHALYFQRAINWASAYDPLDAPLQTEKDDVPAVSAGKLEIFFNIFAGSKFCHLLLLFANSLDPDQA